MTRRSTARAASVERAYLVDVVGRRGIETAVRVKATSPEEAGAIAIATRPDLRILRVRQAGTW